MGKHKIPSLKPGHKFRNRWVVQKKLGGGGYGAVYQVFDPASKGNRAIKTVDAAGKGGTLKMELKVLRLLHSKKQICQVFGAGEENGVSYLVMTLCGPSLSDLQDVCPKQRFSQETTLAVSIQCIQALEEFHSIGFVHRDVKPSNFAIGLENSCRTVFLLDFGICRRIRRSDGSLIEPRHKTSFCGTRRYASINAHSLLELGPCDDMMSFIYSAVEFIKGDLPWSGESSRDLVGQMKRTTPLRTLTRCLPPSLRQFGLMVSTLSYPDQIDYQGALALLHADLKKSTDLDTIVYDWEPALRKKKKWPP